MLYAWDEEFHRLVHMVTNWVGLLDQCSNIVEELCTRLKNMHAESQTITDLIDQLAKFAKIQAKDDRIDAMDEVKRATKTKLL
jgi:light-regulated signal transduction histidine kinase (bacteriophytochrome)